MHQQGCAQKCLTLDTIFWQIGGRQDDLLRLEAEGGGALYIGIADIRRVAQEEVAFERAIGRAAA